MDADPASSTQSDRVRKMMKLERSHLLNWCDIDVDVEEELALLWLREAGWSDLCELFLVVDFTNAFSFLHF
jgi:hypothetical protein